MWSWGTMVITLPHARIEYQNIINVESALNAGTTLEPTETEKRSFTNNSFLLQHIYIMKV